MAEGFVARGGMACGEIYYYSMLHLKTQESIDDSPGRPHSKKENEAGGKGELHLE